MSRMLMLWAVLLLCGVLWCAACGDDDDNDDAAQGGADDDDDNDDASPGDDDDESPDAQSSASPQRDSAVLTEAHAGWRQADCLSCHAGDVHRGGFGGGECVVCHGSNGGPRRAAGHQNADCASCHADRHAGLQFTESQCTACHKYQAGVECPVTETYDAVVIGAGGGGLAAAAALAQGGLKTVLIEKSYKPGGYMVTFRRGDYRFEASLHAINGLTTDRTLAALGVLDKLEPLEADPMYVSVFPDLTQAIPADINAYHALLKALYPAEAANIDALFAELDGIDLIMTALYQLQDGDMSGLATILANLPQALRVLSYINLTLKQFMAQFTQSQELTGMFTQLCTFLGDGPGDLQALYFLTMWNGYHREGYHYLRGGSQAISNALAEDFVAHGGVIKYHTLATKIVVQDGKATQVQTLDDACFNTDYVVSNANAPDTLLKMIGEDQLPADYIAKLKKMTIGPATVQVFLAVDHDYRDLFPATHEMMVNTGYDFDEAFAFSDQGDAAHVPIAIANYTAIDETSAPEGKNAITLTTYLPYDLMNTWHWNEDYQTYVQTKEAVADILVQRAEALLPELTQHIEFMEVGSPVTNYAYSLNPQGSILGFAATPEQSTLKRLPQQTPIDNVVLAGAWTFPGGGQSAVLSSGLGAAGMILDKAGKR